MARTKDFDEDEVLTRAMNLFWRKGYNATSMQDLVDELGISRSSMYDTFGDKHSLFIKALENYKKSASEGMCQIVEKAASSKDAIRMILANMVNELVGDKDQKGCFMVNAQVEVAPNDQAVNELLCNNDREMEQFFLETIKKGQEKGEITDTQDAQLLARFIINSIKGLRVAAKASPDRKVFNDIIDLTLSVLN